MPFVLAVLVLSIYWQVGDHQFVNVDDNQYVVENPYVLRGLTPESVSWAFTTFHAGNWHPLTWLSHMTDVELFGPSPVWHHRMNVLYHLLNTELLFLVLWRMTGGLWQSALVAALFGVHPLHVESVAWVAERKDVLSALFWILTMGAYLRYVRRPTVGRYLIVAATFALGLMCKPMLVTLPFVLLLLDWWPLDRAAPADSSIPPSWRLSLSGFCRLAWEKVPLLGLSASSCVITYLAQTGGGAVVSFARTPFAMRISNAVVSYVVYLWKTAWPRSLAYFYPHPATVQAVIPAWETTGAFLLLCGLSFVALWQRRRPYMAMGWLWYLGTLVPVIGFVQVGGQSLADRYTYVPLIGVFVAVAWVIPAALTGWRFRRIVPVVLGGAVVALSTAAWTQAGYWRDNITLFSRATAVTEKNWSAWNGLGLAYDDLGQHQKAITCYREALRINPNWAEAWKNLGVAYGDLGQPRQAVMCYREAVRILRNFADAWFSMGIAYGDLGQHQQAIACYREALRIRPDYTEVLNNLGVMYDDLGQTQQAIACYREALRIKPDDAKVLSNLSAAYNKLGQQRAITTGINSVRQHGESRAGNADGGLSPR